VDILWISCYKRYSGDVGSLVKENTVKVLVSLPTDLNEWFRVKAFNRRQPKSHLIAEALAEYRDRQQTQLELPLQEELRE
jgi:hypothetical protein